MFVEKPWWRPGMETHNQKKEKQNKPTQNLIQEDEDSCVNRKDHWEKQLVSIFYLFYAMDNF